MSWLFGFSLLLEIFIKLISATDSPCTKSPCLIDDDSLRFVVIGDWGGTSQYPYATSVQKRVAKGMAELNSRKHYHFYLSTGDHFYNRGVKNIGDERFYYTFEKVYNEAAHYKPWYLIAGNHDHNGNISAQHLYSKRNKRWNFPTKFYTINFGLANNSFTAEFIMVDTILLCGQVVDDGDYKHNFDISTSKSKRYWEWLDIKLNSSKANYLFVVGHYPAFSAGYHGSNQCIVKHLTPLLEMYKVNAYLAGHDHNLQYLINEGKSWTTRYVISGFGSKADPYRKSGSRIEPAKLKFFYPDNGNYFSSWWNREKDKGGFVYCNVTSTSGLFSFKDGDGNELYSAKFKPRL